MPKRVYRRCPSCGEASRASALTTGGTAAHFGVDRPATCPACGHIAPAREFARVPKPAEGEGAGGAEPTQPGAKR